IARAAEARPRTPVNRRLHLCVGGRRFRCCTSPQAGSGGGAQRPVHTGERFSLNALMPSLASSLMKTLAEKLISFSSASLSGRNVLSFADCLHARTASGPFLQIVSP